MIPRDKLRTRTASAVLATALLAAVPNATRAGTPFDPAGTERMALRAEPIERFSLRGERRAGELVFLGGLVLRGGGPFFGLSGLERLPGRDAFVAVTDRGHWIVIDVARENGRLARASARTAPMELVGEERRASAVDRDAEAVRLLPDGSALVSFERNHRVMAFDPAGRRTGTVPHPVPPHELRKNGGFEALAVSPPDSPLRGAALVIAEDSVDERGDLFGGVLSGPRRGVFTVRRTDDFAVTDAAFLPDGDLVLLERSFRHGISLRMRLRRIAGDTIGPGARLDGAVLLMAGLSSEIDNMEGLAVHEDERGTVLTLVSDDNGSFLQRTLLLEFLLPDGAGRLDGVPSAVSGPVPVPRMRPAPRGAA